MWGDTTLMAKSVAAGEDKKAAATQEMEQLEKAFTGAMDGLDAFLKAHAAKPAAGDPPARPWERTQMVTKSVQQPPVDDPGLVDGEAFVQGVHQHLDQVEKSFGALQERIGRLEEQLARQLDGTVTIAKSLQAFGSLQKALAGEVAHLGYQPRMRKSVLSIFDKESSGAATGEGSAGKLNQGEVMTKALQAQKAGRLSAVEVAEMDGYFRMGLEPPKRLLDALEG